MTEAQLRAYEAEIAALMDCESLAIIGRVESCHIGNFPVIASPDRPPVAYVADEQNARFFAGAPKIVSELCAEIRRLQTEIHKWEESADIIAMVDAALNSPTRNAEANT